MSQSTEVIQRQSPLVRPIPNTIAYYIIFAALGFVSASLGPTLLGLAENTGSGIEQISILFLARSAGFMLGAFIGGRALDRLPAHWAITAALVMISLTLFMAPLLSYLWLLAMVMLLVGMSMGTLDMGGNTLIMWVHKERIGPYMQGLHLLWGVGAFLSPLMIVLFFEISGSVRSSYWFLSLLFIPALLWIVRLQSPQPEKTEPSLQEAQGINYRLVALAALFLFLYVGAEVTFSGWIFTYSIAMGDIELTTAGYITSIFWGSVTAGRIIAILGAARLRPSVILLSDLAGCLLSVSIILLFPESILALWAGTIGLGLFMASIFPTVLIWVGRRMTVVGSVTRWFFVGASLGAMLFPYVVGQLFERSGPQVTMVMVLALFLAATGVFWLLMRAGGSVREV